jgi:Uma2 family endonuclease
MTQGARTRTGQGPFRPDQLHSGDAYELSEGHAIYCAPTGGDGAGPNLRGGFVIDTDPRVKTAGVDAGFQLSPLTMRAPDVAAGDFSERPGWVQGVPPLAIEYASVGQDEHELREKIDDLLRAGTQHLWVVRLTGPRRVEVYERGAAMRTVRPGETLAAPGVLQNEVPVEALYDREAAHEVALRNLLQRKGYASLADLQLKERAEGREEGREEGALAARRGMLLTLLASRGTVSDVQRARVQTCERADELEAWFVRAVAGEDAAHILGGE